MSEDKDCIDDLINIASSETQFAQAISKVKAIAPNYGTSWPHNCCALFQSQLLDMAGIDFGYEASAGRFAYKLGGQINSRNWRHIPVGQQ